MAMAPSKKGTKKKQNGAAPWRSRPGEAPVPHVSPQTLLLRRTHSLDYALSIIKHPDPIGTGLASEAMVEAAGPDCIIPGLIKPVRILGFQVWPIEYKPKLDTKALQPIGRELRTLNKLLEQAYDLTQKPFASR